MHLEGTTIIAVRRNGKTAIAGDGQVTAGESVIMKSTARKVRSLDGGKVMCGFAGSTADAFTLEELFEKKLRECSGDLLRSAVGLAQQWRSDKILRRLEAMLLVASTEAILTISGAGDVIEPDGDAASIGSGGSFALAAARALLENTDLSASQIARKSLEIASGLCVFTNGNIILEEL